jgi:4'-phosphopantetheinyl transferase
LLVVGVRGNGHRPEARLAIRLALREALAALASVPVEAVMIGSGPGRAPAIEFTAPARIAAPGISISHDGKLSLAAINLRGPVGVDLMTEQDIPDWRVVAADYLGPAEAARLAALPPPLRSVELARAWTRREARLKCLGLQLTEWSAHCPAEDNRIVSRSVALPPGYRGTLAFPG